MLQLLYLLAFTCIALLAMSSIIRSLIMLGTEPNRRLGNARQNPAVKAPHPELLDENGQPIEEPLLVMRSVNVDEARERLDAIFEASPNHQPENSDEV